MKKMKFSFLIPNLGYSKYIFECLDSVMNQIIDSSFEYETIVCDQSDSLVFDKIKQEIKDRYSDKVRLIHSNIKGLFRARHTLMNESSGDYILFIDSDDFIENDYLLTIYKKIVQTNFPDIVITGISKCDEDGLILKNANNYPVDLAEHVNDYFLYSSMINSVCIKIFKRELYHEKDYCSFNYQITNGEDFYFSFPLMEKARQVEVEPRIKKYHYRMLHTSMTHKLGFQTSLNTLKLKKEILENRKMNDFQKNN